MQDSLRQGFVVNVQCIEVALHAVTSLGRFTHVQLAHTRAHPSYPFKLTAVLWVALTAAPWQGFSPIRGKRAEPEEHRANKTESPLPKPLAP